MIYLLTMCLLLVLPQENDSALNGVWRWECKNGYCQKAAITANTEDSAQSLGECRLRCSDAAALWPKPTGAIHVGDKLVKVNPIDQRILKSNSEESVATAAIKHFVDGLKELLPRNTKAVEDGKSLIITRQVANSQLNELTLDVDESYNLTVSERSDGNLVATIAADNTFGYRNGLETLSQLIVYDDLRDEYLIPDEVHITDRPAYAWRGLGLDTSRNYISVEKIKKTLRAMGASKLNSFHWHITDTHSFPFTSESLPDLVKYGAYSPQKVYTPQDVAEIVRYGLEHGVRVIPEFDAPAHVGEGWQNTDFVICFDAKPWQDHCVEPPCGQFDPTKEGLYDALEALYGDMLNQFKPPVFHMGGDEVHFYCWNNSASIVEWMQNEKGWGRSEENFVQLWDYFQNQSVARLYRKAQKQIPVILWTSTLTRKEFLRYLPKDNYIIQIWTLGNDSQVTDLLDNGYKVILSNYDALYLDCGFAGWVTDGNNWCSPYVGWQKVYDNKPELIAGERKNQVLGAEAILWTEQVDSAGVDNRLWPRAAALAEVLWSEPKTSWREAEPRMLIHRERLVNFGIKADALEPEWCTHYEDSCPIDGYHNQEPTEEPSRPGGATVTSTSIALLLVNAVIVLW